MDYILCGLMRVTNTDWQAEYGAAMTPLLSKHSGELVAAGLPKRFEGGGDLPDKLVILRFPDESSAMAWYQDPDHQKLVTLRQSGAKFELIGIESNLKTT